MSQVTGKKTALKIALIPIAMFGFGYALVPLYNVFCDLTGLGGRSVGQANVEDIDPAGVDKSRDIQMEYVTSINGDLPWQFKSLSKTVRINPGALNEAHFVVENRSDRTIVGRAVYNVTPAEAAVYLSKTECFCYTEQTLEPGETMEMPMRFVVDTDLPERIKGMTLSYTFFESPNASPETASKAKSEDAVAGGKI